MFCASSEGRCEWEKLKCLRLLSVRAACLLWYGNRHKALTVLDVVYGLQDDGVAFLKVPSHVASCRSLCKRHLLGLMVEFVLSNRKWRRRHRDIWGRPPPQPSGSAHLVSQEAAWMTSCGHLSSLPWVLPSEGYQSPGLEHALIVSWNKIIITQHHTCE